MDRWRPDYVQRAALAETELTQLFQEAVMTENSDDLIKHGGVSKSLSYIAKQAEQLEHRIVLFLYSEQLRIVMVRLTSSLSRWISLRN
jgi:hypothetical protein